MKMYCFLLAGFGLLSGCTVGPDYTPPTVELPQQWRFSAADVKTYASLEWWKSLGDPQLSRLIEIALQENNDLKIALARIGEYRALLGISESALSPKITLNGTFAKFDLGSGAAYTSSSPSSAYAFYYLPMNLSYEIDFWGHVKRQNEAAMADLLAQEAARQILILTLISDVAGTYIQLIALDQQLDVARKTFATRKQQEKLIRDRFKFGLSSDIDLQQAESETASAQAQIPLLEQAIAQQENALSLLLGRNPQPILRGKLFAHLKNPSVGSVPLPSTLLKRRPDIQKAEQEVRSSNAKIGVAQAEYFPQVNLISLLGLQAVKFPSLFSGTSALSEYGANFTLPLLTGDATKNKVLAAKEQHQQTLSNYVKTIQTAFKEVEDALIACQKTKEQQNANEQIVSALAKTLSLAKSRYMNGLSNYLDVATAEDQLFAAQLTLIDIKKQNFMATISLYKALGGGW